VKISYRIISSLDTSLCRQRLHADTITLKLSVLDRKT